MSTKTIYNGDGQEMEDGNVDEKFYSIRDLQYRPKYLKDATQGNVLFDDHIGS